jgi:hypothetical protein
LNTINQFFGDDADRQQAYRDFADRYEQDPAQLTGPDVTQHYSELATYLDEKEMDPAHEQAFGKLSEEDRRALAQEFQYADRDPMRSFNGYPNGTNFNQMMQPRQLGRMTRKAAQHDLDLLNELVGPQSPLTGSGTRDAVAAATVTLATRYLSKNKTS